MLKLAYIIESLSPLLTGTTSSAQGLTLALKRRGVDLRIVARCPDREAAAVERRFEGLARLVKDSESRATFAQAIDNAVAWCDLAQISGVWDPSTRMAAASVRRHGKPHIYSVRGMLDPRRLRDKWWKKWPYAVLLGRRTYARASAVHALTPDEEGYLRQWRYHGPVFITPNGVELPQREAGPEPFYDACPQARGKRVLLYLSRIDRQKGGEELIRAFGQLAERYPDWLLVMAGNTQQPKFLQRVKELVQREGWNGRIVFPGFLYEDARWSALETAEIFTLPSYSEGFSNAILEALAWNCACLITPHCSFPDVVECGAGLSVEPAVETLTGALEELLSSPAETLAGMARKGRALVEARYTWDAVAAQMIEQYRKILT
ncbi:glycosyltransferase [Candidatus Sumerlaeota bacterium]|nr:glycosyltransferase [Candidatus Sumerlaeota bacterium]